MATLKNKSDIEKMREGGRVLATILKETKKYTQAGIKTSDINTLAEKLCAKHGVEPAFKGYMGYPFSICVSINDEVVHGIPSDRIVKDGDLVSLDFGVFHRGFYTDAGVSFGVGKIDKTKKKLIDVAEKSFFVGAKKLHAGVKLGDVSSAIQEYIEENGFSVVRCLAGHGVGRELHEAPIVPNYGKKGSGEVLEEGVVLAIEPMVTEKDFELEIDADGWTYRTLDGGMASYFEHTVIVTKKGYEILTTLS